MTWQAGDMEGARFVVDVGMWLSCLVFRQLSWFVGSRGCSWWGVTCGAVVVGRSRGGGCGMKKEGVSQFVTHVSLDQRSNTH